MAAAMGSLIKGTNEEARRARMIHVMTRITNYKKVLCWNTWKENWHDRLLNLAKLTGTQPSEGLQTATTDLDELFDAVDANSDGMHMGEHEDVGESVSDEMEDEPSDPRAREAEHRPSASEEGSDRERRTDDGGESRGRDETRCESKIRTRTAAARRCVHSIYPTM